MVDEGEKNQSCFEWIKRRKLNSEKNQYFEYKEKSNMADASKSETGKLLEKSRKNFGKQKPVSMIQNSASVLNMQKENRVRKNSEGSNNMVKRLQMRYEEISNLQKNVAIVGGENYRNSGAINKRVENNEEKNNVLKKRVCFSDRSAEFLHPVSIGTNKWDENKDYRYSGMKNRGDFGDENKRESRKRIIIDATEKEIFTKSRFKVWADISPLRNQETVTKNITADTNENSTAGETFFAGNRKLQRLIVESRNTDLNRLTPIETQGVPLIPKKIKVQHRTGANTGAIYSKTTKSIKVDSIWNSTPFTLPYEENLVDSQLVKEKPLSRIVKNKNITVEQRKIVLKFLIHLSTHKFYPSFFLYQAVRIFDAVLNVKIVSIENIQLVALTAMWIALKREQIPYKVPTATEMISYSKDLYQGKVDLLMKCEIEILQALNFEIVFPDPFLVLYYYITIYSRSQLMLGNHVELAYYCGSYMIDLSLFDEDLLQTSAVLIAAAAAETALFFALEEVKCGQDPMWFKWRSLDAASRFSDTEIVSVSTKLINLINNSCIRHTDGEIVFKKYTRSRYGRVSHFLCNKVRILRSEG